MPTKIIHKYDLPAIVDFMMKYKKEAELWKMINLQFTYSRVKKQSDMSEFKDDFKPAPKTDEDYERIHKNKEEFLHSFEAFTDYEIAIIEKAMDSIKKVIKIDWKEVDDEESSKKAGNIRLFKSVYFYKSILSNVSGYIDHINVSDDQVFSYFSLNTKECNLSKKNNEEITDNHDVVDTARHELGHVLGLGHTFGQPFDEERYTMMSYDKPAFNAHSGLMVYDILTLQAYYGANNETNKGNTYYNFATFGDVSKKQCIWDAAGSDTIDTSEVSVKILDIREGEFSCNSQQGHDYFMSFAYKTKIENVTSCQYGESTIFLNQENNVVNISGGDNTLYFSDYNVNVDINHKTPFHRVKQKVFYQGWGHDILYSCKMKYHYSDRVVLDVSNPMALRFRVKGKDLLVTNITVNRKTNEKHLSSLLITNFVAHSDKYLFLVRTKTERQTELCQNKYHNSYYQNAQSLIKKGHFNDYDKKPKISLNKAILEKIKEYDDKIAYISKSRSIKTDTYIPLVIGL